MEIEIHKTTMSDGQSVTDVDIMTNTLKEPHITPRCIFTFNDEDVAMDFANRFDNLCAEFDMVCIIEVTD
jgi:hypothetical protein